MTVDGNGADVLLYENNRTSGRDGSLKLQLPTIIVRWMCCHIPGNNVVQKNAMEELCTRWQVTTSQRYRCAAFCTKT